MITPREAENCVGGCISTKSSKTSTMWVKATIYCFQRIVSILTHVIAGLSRWMVPFGICHNWWSLSWALHLPIIYCSHFWSSLCSSIYVVHSYRATWPLCTEVCRLRWSNAYIPVWWLGLHHFHGRPWLAWHFHDLVSCAHPSMDNRMPYAVPHEPTGYQVQENASRTVLWNTRSIDLFLYSA